jgi:hypothetical protein
VYTGKESKEQLLALADHAQRSASHGGLGARKRMTTADGARAREHGADALRGMLKRRLEKGDIEVEWSPVLATSDLAVLHREALVRIVDDSGNRLPAGQFISLAEQMGVASTIDRLVVERVMDRMTETVAGSVAVNLSTASLNDPNFMAWLCRILKQLPDGTGELFFECREFDFINGLPALHPLHGQYRPRTGYPVDCNLRGGCRYTGNAQCPGIRWRAGRWFSSIDIESGQVTELFFMVLPPLNRRSKPGPMHSFRPIPP